MKPFFLVIITMFIFSSLFSQKLDWAFNIGGSSQDNPTFMHIDASENIYTLGQYRYTVDFNPLGIPVTKFVSYPWSALAKYDSTGQNLWVFHMENWPVNVGLVTMYNIANYRSKWKCLLIWTIY